MSELISLIIPVYNVENYIAECLDSVIDQTYSNIEVLLINDGSTDKSLAICMEYAKRDNRIVLIDKENEGLSIARQTGIDRCQGMFFSTIDSDDVLDTFYIEKMYTRITEKKADICLCGRRSFGSENIEFAIDDVDDFITVSKEYNCKNYANAVAKFQMSDSWNKMYRTEFVKNSGIRFYLAPKYNGTDMLFNHLLFLHCPKICTVKEQLYNYRVIKNSRVRRKNKPLQEGFEFIISELMKERKALNYPKEIDYQIYAIYISMIKYVTQDIVEECGNTKECHERLKHCVISSTKFNREEFLTIRDILESTNMKLFLGLLNKSSVGGIEMYYKVRSIMRK